MEVYRVEDPKGFGPYSGTNHFSASMMTLHSVSHELIGRHPIEGSSGFGGPGDFEDLRWGFATMFDLRLWFDYFGQDGYNWLIERKFIIKVLDAPVHAVHRTQVTFDMKFATVLRTEQL